MTRWCLVWMHALGCPHLTDVLFDYRFQTYPIGKLNPVDWHYRRLSLANTLLLKKLMWLSSWRLLFLPSTIYDVSGMVVVNYGLRDDTGFSQILKFPCCHKFYFMYMEVLLCVFHTGLQSGHILGNGCLSDRSGTETTSSFVVTCCISSFTPCNFNSVTWWCFCSPTYLSFRTQSVLKRRVLKGTLNVSY